MRKRVNKKTNGNQYNKRQEGNSRKEKKPDKKL